MYLLVQASALRAVGNVVTGDDMQVRKRTCELQRADVCRVCGRRVVATAPRVCVPGIPSRYALGAASRVRGLLCC